MGIEDEKTRPALRVPAPDGARVMARKRTIAVIRALRDEGMLERHLGLEVSFEKSATPLERMRVLAGMTLSEAWRYECKRYSSPGTLRLELDLGGLFGLD